MYEDEIASVNSEIRYITLELMKLASRRRTSFAEVANEFISNAYILENVIMARSVRRNQIRMRSAKPATVKKDKWNGSGKV